MKSELYLSALALCQLGLSQTRAASGKPLRREDIQECVTEILDMKKFKGQVDGDALVKELEELFTIWSDLPGALDNDDDNHEPWLEQRGPDINWRFWNRYRLYLTQNPEMSPAALDSLSRVTEDVLGRLEDPQRQGPWDRRGLVMGDVQSGKTGTYVGLICKAADAGYKVIVVLAGMHNNLRSQTQIRLDEGFLGYKAAVPKKSGGAMFEPTGVGISGPPIPADSVTNRFENGDFSRSIAKQFSIHPGGNPLLFVVKKNVSVLKHLLGYIESKADAKDPETGRKYHRDTSLLVLDDEADQASVDVRAMAIDENGVPDPEHDPSKTNELIRKLLRSFNKSAYVAFTATPFANIFIHDKGWTEKLGDDLFPRSFIVNLPAPSNYTGASRIFGVAEDQDVGIAEVKAAPVTRLITDHAATDSDQETSGWMPPKLQQKTGHVPLCDGERRVPPSLRKAILSFLVTSTVRKIREEGPLFNSMLVHVVRFTSVQNIVKEEVQEELDSIAERLRLGDGDRKPSILDELESLWSSDFVATSSAMGPQYMLPDWADIRDQIGRVAGTVKVRIINGSAADALDYDEYKATGLNVIAVGGDKLSRGLTLYGLVTSYFLRSSRMYDTLMQMGRWFGYRDKYLDVCRLYMTADLKEWFRHIAAATEELRLEFEHMVSVRAKPSAYGLKVRSHPTLLVTSQTKMKTGTELSLSYSGAISETIIFDKDQGVIDSNLNATRTLLDSVGDPASGDVSGGYIWHRVGSQKILDFLGAYSSHSNANRADTRLLARYIRRQLEDDELVSWTVKLASSGTGLVHFDDLVGGKKVQGITRSVYPLENENDMARYSIRRLVSPSDELCDLSDDELKIALEHTRLLWERSTRTNKPKTEPDAPSGPGIRFARAKHKALLIIYPLDPAVPKTKSGVPVIGIALSFPNSATAKPITYRVTNLFTELGVYDDF